MTDDGRRGEIGGFGASRVRSEPVRLPDSVRPTEKRRRPSGAPPPLPRSLGTTGRLWLAALGAMLALVVAAAASPAVRRGLDRADAAVLRAIARARADWLDGAVGEVSEFGSGWTVTVVAVALIVALLALKRWRHLFTFLGGVAVVEIAGQIAYNGFARPRPYDVTTIGRWAGYSLPSPPVAVMTILCVGVVYTLVVPGRPRGIAKLVAAGVVAVFVASRLYLAVDHPFDVAVGVTLAVGVLVNAFRTFTPNEVFPVHYRRGRTAHLDVGGRRGEAIRQAVGEQLGLTVLDVRPVGLEGSAGSTPLRLTVAGDPPTYLFGKLYAMSHVRADRWYKLGRTLLYGRLEDEAPFQSVRRLVEYEDYTARVLRDAGITTAATYGIVELTPEREYLLVTEFFDGAHEIGDADVDDTVIDEALLIIRRLWDAGLAHRDIKPSNLLVRGSQVILIDVFFVQVRPSPWRQAVDLANMMLVLAVRTDARRVYERALRLFTPDDIAEAFAAARGIASPTQLRSALKRDRRDLVAEFRSLAPARRPISLQRWSLKRVGLALGVLAGGALAVVATTSMFTPAHDIGVQTDATCNASNAMVLMAQSVPSATFVPCVATLPAGWEVEGVKINSTETVIRLRAGRNAPENVAVTLAPPERCDVTGATEVPSDEVGMARFERPERLPPDLRSTRYYVFPGGCTIYRFAFGGDTSASLIVQLDQALGFLPRSRLVARVESRAGLGLCGTDVECAGDR